METSTYRILINADNAALAGQLATNLTDILREVDNVCNVSRVKDQVNTMDLGAIVSVVATSGASLALAKGLSAWLQARRNVSLTIERANQSGSLKATISGIDPDTALRIVEQTTS